MEAAEGRRASVSEWPITELERVEICPVCGGERRDILHEGLTDRVFGCAPGLWSLQCCVACRSAYLDPRPTEASISRAYGNYYTHFGPDGGGSSLRRLWRMLVAAHLNRAYRLEYRPAVSVGAVLVPLAPRLRRNAERRARHLKLPSRRARLLDVGCGSGAFVAEARAAGWDAEGIDVDPASIELGRKAGRPVRLGRVDGDVVLDGAFEAVTLSHVIEHVHDPAATLEGCAAKLRPGGMLWIATPDLESWGHQRFGRDWVHLDPPRHLQLFTVDSLRGLVEAAGFTELRVLAAPSTARHSFPASHAIRSGVRPFEGAGAPLSIRAMAFVTDMRTQASGRRTDELVLVARKPVKSAV